MTESDLHGVADAQVAIYLDMDNLVAGRYDQIHGKQSWRSDNPNARRDRDKARVIRDRLEAARIQIGSIVDYGSSFGQIAVNRGYGNWTALSNERYSSDLLRNAVDLVQLFPVSGTKNGADIRLAVDVIDDLTLYPHITHVVIAAGDSDYIPLAQRCKRLGRRVIGIGIAGSTNRYFQLACDQFRLYDRLPGVDAREESSGTQAARIGTLSTLPADPVSVLPAVPQAATDLQAAAESQTAPDLLLAHAAALVAERSDAEWWPLTLLKQQMRRLDPAFDESVLGHRGFKSFVAAWPDIVEMTVHGEHGHTSFRPRGMAGHATDDEVPEVPATSRQHPTDDHPTPPDTDLGTDTVTAGTNLPKHVEVAEDEARLRLQYGWGKRTAFGTEWERASIAAVRHAVAMTADAPLASLSPRELGASLLESSPALGEATTRLATQTMAFMLPLLLRTTDGLLFANPELAVLDDDALTKRIRQAAAGRNAAKSFPEPVETTAVVGALYAGEQVPAGAAETIAEALSVATAPALTRALGSDALPPLVLADITAALTTIPAGIAIYSAADFIEFMAPALADAGLDTPRDALLVFFRLATTSGILSDGGDANAGWHNTMFRVNPDDAALAIARVWIARLLGEGLLQPDSWLSMEAVYRIAIPDYLNAARREDVAQAVRDARTES